MTRWITPRIKVAAGIVLLMPALALVFYSAGFAFDNPGLTGTQLFNEVGWVPWAAIVAAIPGLMLVQSAIAEDEEC